MLDLGMSEFHPKFQELKNNDYTMKAMYPAQRKKDNPLESTKTLSWIWKVGYIVDPEKDMVWSVEGVFFH